jgi:hypothetical protein
MRGWGVIALSVMLAGCGRVSPEVARQEVARLRASFEKHRGAYLAGVEAENRLVPETLAWLKGGAVSAPRGEAVAGARLFREKWAKVHFVPRVIHEALRFDEYRSAEVRAAQRRMLEHLRRSYEETHVYQRYAQRASETRLHGAAVGVLPVELQAFRRGLEGRPRAADQVTPLLEFGAIFPSPR